LGIKYSRDQDVIFAGINLRITLLFALDARIVRIAVC